MISYHIKWERKSFKMAYNALVFVEFSNLFCPSKSCVVALISIA